MNEEATVAGDATLDRLFHALSDPTRRRILTRLTLGPVGVTELARPFRMSLPAVSKHLKVLEQAGLISRSIDGRAHRLALTARTLERVETWLDPFRSFWDEQLRALGTDLARHPSSRAARRTVPDRNARSTRRPRPYRRG